MDIELIKCEITELLKMVEQWSCDGEASNIERDIALDKIKKLYEQLRFSNIVAPSRPTTEESKELEVEVELTYYEGEEEEVEINEEQYEEEEEDEEDEEDEPLIPFELIDISIIPENEDIEEEEKEEKEEPKEEEPHSEEPHSEENKEPLQETTAPTENALFDISTIPIRQKSRRSAILSLYNDDDTPNPYTPPTPANRPSTTKSIEEFEIVERETTETKIESEPTYVTTIADRYAEQATSNTIASSSTSSSSINDRYIISQELFGGDMHACDAMLNTLQEFDNFDDGMIYIIENYDWNPDCDAAKLVVKLLEQRFLS